ncbi:MAG TPA: pantetheine-phosphate adenylyltransferase [Candidatus Merdicola faecigallinarum]|uniref:Phosphopantetheine adenylyltransferase n=1 Tax=Candidatus Merdicola faecigallinarum TaxID=2840862 RepID=A0A9D1M0X6_9FIRM|nr:pantetheine-phosphate adenylyltransferase [Candidatus Merdicola faecigallinarum]
MKIGFYPGSFDPFTNGHLHVVKTAADLFDKVIIGIGNNPQKERRFPNEQMKLAIEKTLKTEKLTNVEVIIYQNLSVDTALQYHANYIIRGLRNDMDYSYEENLAQINEEISGLDTIYLRSGLLGFISSSMVTELIQNGRNVSNYLPSDVIQTLNLS